MPEPILYKKLLFRRYILLVFLLHIVSCSIAIAQTSGQKLERYKPEWIKDGFAVAGPTWEPWMFMVRRNNSEMTEHNFSN
jgi:hypothetical protein